MSAPAAGRQKPATLPGPVAGIPQSRASADVCNDAHSSSAPPALADMPLPRLHTPHSATPGPCAPDDPLHWRTIARLSARLTRL